MVEGYDCGSSIKPISKVAAGSSGPPPLFALNYHSSPYRELVHSANIVPCAKLQRARPSPRRLGRRCKVVCARGLRLRALPHALNGQSEPHRVAGLLHRRGVEGLSEGAEQAIPPRRDDPDTDRSVDLRPTLQLGDEPFRNPRDELVEPRCVGPPLR